MKNIIYILFGIMALVLTTNVYAQEKLIEAKIISDKGEPLQNVIVKSGDNVTSSDEFGMFAIEASTADVILFELIGYETKIVQVVDFNDSSVELIKTPPGGSSNLKLPYREVAKEQFTGAATVIKAEQLRSSLDINVAGALKGKAAGLYIKERPEDHGGTYEINIRGINGLQNDPLILIDGVERNIDYLQASDIESVTVLKDAVSKSFYKGKAANGILLITTKRGIPYKNEGKVSVETGMSKPQMLPDPLSSTEYVEYYNLARRNSGLGNLYNQAEIDGYKNPDIQFPSNNYYDELLNESKNYTRVLTSFRGGNKSVKYSIQANYLHDGGLEGVGDANSSNRFSIRSNLDFDLNRFVSFFVDVNAYLEQNNTNYLYGNDLFERMNIQRPNEYTHILRNSSYQDSVRYGAGRFSNNSDYQNLYAEMLLGGIRENVNRVGQVNLGTNLDLSNLLNGLSGKVSVHFDSENFIALGKNDDFYSYLPTFENGEIVGLHTMTRGKKNSGLSRLATRETKRFTAMGQLDYHKEFTSSVLNMNLAVFRDKSQTIYSFSPTSTQSNTLLTNYIVNDKYVVDLNLAFIGSSRLPEDNNYGFFPAVGAGWILSEEDFLSENEKINYLKLKASYGLSGTDESLNFFGYMTRWNYAESSNNTNFGIEASNSIRTADLNTVANEQIDWEKSAELNIGFEAILFENFLLNVDYYNMNRTNVPIYEHEITNQVSGLYNRQINFVSIKNNGIDGTMTYENNFGNWRILASVNANYSKALYDKSQSVDLPTARNMDGKPVDAFMGYESKGIIKNESELAGLNQRFGEVRVGDLAYNDISGDGKIDEKDQVELGNLFPRLQFGANLKIAYKKVDLMVSGYGAAMYDLYLNNSYYRPQPERAYSQIVKETYNPETGKGEYPALTVNNADNNYQPSDFWLENGNYFKIKELELGVSLPASWIEPIRLDTFRFYVRGNNLMTLTGIKDVDPEYINAGFTTYPYMRTFTIGMNLNF
jgi:TonB-dependent starch-binding outer membrane protein SusC